MECRRGLWRRSILIAVAPALRARKREKRGEHLFSWLQLSHLAAIVCRSAENSAPTVDGDDDVDDDGGSVAAVRSGFAGGCGVHGAPIVGPVRAAGGGRWPPQEAAQRRRGSSHTVPLTSRRVHRQLKRALVAAGTWRKMIRAIADTYTGEDQCTSAIKANELTRSRGVRPAPGAGDHAARPVLATRTTTRRLCARHTRYSLRTSVKASLAEPSGLRAARGDELEERREE